MLLAGGVSATYANTGDILFERADALMAVPFDAVRLEPRGQPVPVLDDVGLQPGPGSAEHQSTREPDWRPNLPHLLSLLNKTY